MGRQEAKTPMDTQQICAVVKTILLPLLVNDQLARDRAAHIAIALAPNSRVPAEDGPIVDVVFQILQRTRQPHIWQQFGMLSCPEYSDSEARAYANRAAIALAQAGYVDEAPGGSEGSRRNAVAFEVMAKRCDQCLYSDAKIVTDDAKDAILASCEANGHHFVCHKATIAGWDVACAGWHAANPSATVAQRMAASMGLVRFVTEAQLVERSRFVIEWLPSWSEDAAENQEACEHELRRAGRSPALEARIRKLGGRIVQR